MVGQFRVAYDPSVIVDEDAVLVESSEDVNSMLGFGGFGKQDKSKQVAKDMFNQAIAETKRSTTM